MKIYKQNVKDDIGQSITNMIEKETDNKIFTLRIVGETKEALEVLVVFENKEIINGIITIQEIEGTLAARLQANYI